MATVIILLGAPGSGKGTVAAELSKQRSIPHISIGDLFYENLKNKTELGLHAQRYLEKGQLVPDDLVLDIVYDRISKPDCENGYILDGIPKNIAQVHELEDYLRNKATVVAVKLNVNDETATNRLSNRMICEKCGRVWSKNGHCEICQGELTQRSDDKPDAIKERLKVYHEQTEPLERFYKDAGQLKEVDGTKPVDEVLKEILTLV